jgi:fructosamine-3-kinase
MTHPLAQAAERLLGEAVVGVEPLHGGDLSEVLRLRMASRRRLVVKSGPFPGREAGMLRAIRAAGVRAPEPVAVGEGALVLEDLGPEAPPSEAAWRDLGCALRRLHAAEGPSYGWDADHAFGPVAIRNSRSDGWPEFWIGRRLLADTGRLPADIAARIGSLAPRMAARLPDRPRPSLLHGDLWTGNVHFGADGRAALIDPACCHGDAEADLAMLTLFGRPPSPFWQAYGDLAPGWEARRPIYRLWPALVHLRLFGEGYRPLVEGCLEAIA